MDRSEKAAPKKRRKPAPLEPPPLPAQSGLAGLDPERRKKIAGIRKALDEGTYRVSNEDVAGKLIEHMLRPKK